MRRKEPVYTPDDLREFLKALLTHLARENAPGKRLREIRSFVTRLDVVDTGEGAVLHLREWRDVDKDALFWLNRNHMPIKFRAQAAKPPHLARSVRRLRNEDFTPSVLPVPSPTIILRDDDLEAIKHRVQALEAGRQAVLVQHSNTTSRPLVTALLNRGADVELYLQDAGHAMPAVDAERIRAMFNNTCRHYTRDGGSLRVFLYKVPPSLRAVWVVDEFVAVSWYTLHQLSEPSETKWCEIYGHNRPIIIAGYGSDEYELLAEMVEDVVESMRVHALAPALDLARGRQSVPTRE